MNELVTTTWRELLLCIAAGSFLGNFIWTTVSAVWKIIKEKNKSKPEADIFTKTGRPLTEQQRGNALWDDNITGI